MTGLISDAVIGSVIAFKSKAANDNNNYIGKVIGFTTYEVAKSYTDIFTYNANVQSIDNTVPDTELLEFMLIQLHEAIDGSTKYLIPFAKSWILESSFDIISSNRKVDVTVYDADATNAQDIIDLLKAANFKCKISRIY